MKSLSRNDSVYMYTASEFDLVLFLYQTGLCTEIRAVCVSNFTG